MENVLVLNGSPRGRVGNTARLTEKFLQGYKSARDKELKLDYIELKDKNIKTCTGCFSCWTTSPGECVLADDMKDLLDKYISAEFIIWATPLYHHGMTSLMKRFTERTLPLNHPEIVEIEGSYSHPQRHDLSQQENILIASCGFPERENFQALEAQFEQLLEERLNEKILTVMGELLRKEPLASRISWYLEAVEQAGKEYAENRSFTEETRKTLKKPLVPVEDFIEMANASWKQQKTASSNQTEADHGPEEQQEIGYNFLKMMKHAFNPEAAGDLQAVMEFEFTDIEETHHFVIAEGSCELKRGPSHNFTAKIITPFATWQKISEGEIDGGRALMEGMYSVEGELSLIKRLDELFAKSTEEEASSNSDLREESEEEKSDSILMSRKAMTFSFIPWIISWIFVEMNWGLGVLVPLIFSLGLVVLKGKKQLEITYFERVNLLYFSVLTLISAFNYSMLQEVGTQFNYFSIAVIWFISVLFGRALPMDYSRHNYPEVAGTELFKRINNIITLVWTGIFTVMGLAVIFLKSREMMHFSPLLYLLIIAGLVFTSYFPEKYQEYLFS